MDLGEFLYDIQSFLNGRKITKKAGLEEINYWLKLANHELYRIKVGFGDEGGFETNNQISDAIEDFITEPTSITLTTGIGNLPADYNRRVSLYYISGSDKIPIDIVSSEEFINRQNNANRQPTTTHPIARIRNSKIEVNPTSITPVYLTYIALPTTPVLGMTVTDGVLIYSAGDSTEFAWKEEYHLDLLRLVLKYIGISDDELVGLAGFNKQEVNEENV